MGKGSPAPVVVPQGPNPNQVAAAQTASNIGTAIAQQHLLNTNQETPYGNLTYQQNGTTQYIDPTDNSVYEIPRYTAVQTLSPEQQAILDQNNASSLNLATLGNEQSSRLDSLLDRPIDASSAPAAGDPTQIRRDPLGTLSTVPLLQTELGDAGEITRTYGTDFSQARQDVEDALMARLDPRIEQDRSRLESRLASQGIRIGSEAYNDSMDQFERQVNDARLGAVIGAGQEHTRLSQLEAQRADFENQAQQQDFSQESQRAAFRNATLGQDFDNVFRATGFNNQTSLQETNNDLAQFNAQNNARAQSLNEMIALRNQPLNEITAILSGSQITNPNFITPQTAQIANTDIAGIQSDSANRQQQAAIFNAQQQAAAQQSRNSLFGGLLGGFAGLLSDERAKTDIKKVGKTDDGQNVYQFRYKTGGPIQMGLMAQEVEKKKPEAVREVGGFKTVDYGIALGEKAA